MHTVHEGPERVAGEDEGRRREMPLRMVGVTGVGVESSSQYVKFSVVSEIAARLVYCCCYSAAYRDIHLEVFSG